MEEADQTNATLSSVSQVKEKEEADLKKPESSVDRSPVEDPDPAVVENPQSSVALSDPPPDRYQKTSSLNTAKESQPEVPSLNSTEHGEVSEEKLNGESSEDAVAAALVTGDSSNPVEMDEIADNGRKGSESNTFHRSTTRADTVLDKPPPVVMTSNQQSEEHTASIMPHLPMSPTYSDDGSSMVERMSYLEVELTKSQSIIATLRRQQSKDSEDAASEPDWETSSVMKDLQSNLQQQLCLKAEAENRARIAEAKVQEMEGTIQKQANEIERFQYLQAHGEQQMEAKAEAEDKARLAEAKVRELEARCEEQSQELAKFEGLQSDLEQQMSAKTELENKLRVGEESMRQLEEENKGQEVEIENILKQMLELKEAHDAQEEELQIIREERDEQHRREMALTSRLNAAKKKEADKANLAEEYEEDITSAKEELEETKQEVLELRSSKQALEQDMQHLKQTAKERLRQLETSLTEERKLNEDRKRKMKSFIQNKSDELGQAKADNESLQNELNQTNKSLLDLNGRWKQLHAQWVQSQTRNRELQRDLNRIKKDSENLHKVGGTLEMKLSRSANETEEHKNKRLAAKHELMTVLRTLEAEREVSTKLRDSIKFTFVPKALSQQQLLRESLEEFEAELLKLSQRLRQPLPPVVEQGSSHLDLSDGSRDGFAAAAEDATNGDNRVARSDSDNQRLISKLEYESQRVSRCIMLLTSGIERMRQLLDSGGDRTCYTVLSEILTTGTAGATNSRSPQEVQEETSSLSGHNHGRRLGAIRSHHYGQVPSSAPS